MIRFSLTALFFVTLVLPNKIFGQSLEDSILIAAPKSNVNSCIIYNPIIGTTKDGENLKVNSDKFEFTEDERLILKGSVELDFPNGLLRANKADLDRKNGKIEFSGGGDIFLDQFYFKSDSGFFNKEDKSISLTKGKAYLDERSLIFNFDKLDGNLESLINLESASITSCADIASGWVLEAKNIELNSEKQRGLAKKVRVKVKGATVFAFPVVPFATSEKRMTGFLEPSISFSSDGLDLMIPFYKVLTERSDITIAPRNIAKRGAGIEANYRSVHGLENNFRNIDLIYFDKDDEFLKQNFEKPSSRWAFNIKDKFNLRNSYIDINWAKASDSLILRDMPGDITSIGLERAQNLNQNISISTSTTNAVIRLEHQGFQSLNPILTNGYKKSPALDIKYSKRFGSIFLTERINIASFKADSIHGYVGYENMNGQFLRIIENPPEGLRVYSDINLSKYNHLNGFNINTNLGIKTISYNLSNKSSNTNNVVVPNILIDINSLFIKSNKASKSSIEPRLIFGYTPYKNQNNNPVFDSDDLSMNNELFVNRRFSGMDRVGDQKFYTLSMKYSKFHMNMEKLQISISKKYYLKDRKLFLSSMSNPTNSMAMHSMNMSSMMMDDMPMDRGPLVIMSKWMPNMRTMLMAYGGYFDSNKKVPLAGITYKQKIKNGTLGYAKRYRRMSGDFLFPMNYSEIFADINLNNNFKFIARLKRDNENDINIENVVGFEYENCCFALRLTGSDKNLSKYVMHDEKIYYPYLADAWDNIIQIENKGRINFEFELKGFNSSLDRVNRFLNNSLFNY